MKMLLVFHQNLYFHISDKAKGRKIPEKITDNYNNDPNNIDDLEKISEM